MIEEFSKYEALGNDYIVLDPFRTKIPITAASVALLCDRHRGIGADGVLYGPFFDGGSIRLQIFNSDGSECERSGNGLRMFAQYLLDHSYVTGNEFSLRTLAGEALVEVTDRVAGVFTVAMGTYNFDSERLPATGPKRKLLNEKIKIDGDTFTVCCVNVGNPHCVVLVDKCTREQATLFGPLISSHEMFPLGINVQFVSVRDRGNVDAEIWERGAGYTLASGSSACAIASVLYEIGHIESEVIVHMRGGQLKVTHTLLREIFLTGESRAVVEGRLASGFVDRIWALGNQ